MHETTIASKLLARVVEVNLKAGQSVHAGDVLVRLDDTDLRAKLQQAKAAVASADAHHSQAVSDERRSAQLRKTNVVSQQEYEKNVTAVTSSAAELLRAQESVKEMQAMLDWATVRSPIDGIVTDKKIDVGDMVTPGQVLLTLFDPKQMQLVASVRESLTHQLQIGQKHRRAGRRSKENLQRDHKRDRARSTVGQPDIPGKSHGALSARESTPACSDES